MNANTHLLGEFLNIMQYQVVFLQIYHPIGSSVLAYFQVYLLTFCHTQLTKYWNVSDLNWSSTDASCHMKAECLATFITFFSDMYCITPVMHSTREVTSASTRSKLLNNTHTHTQHITHTHRHLRAAQWARYGPQRCGLLSKPALQDRQTCQHELCQKLWKFVELCQSYT